MRLLSIESSAEEEHLAQIIEAADIGTQSGWWTSGSDFKVQDHWVWTATGQPLNYTNWAPGEPNNVGGVEHYIAIVVKGRSITWYDAPAHHWPGHDYIKTICEY
jgi:hypothetical protein